MNAIWSNAAIDEPNADWISLSQPLPRKLPSTAFISPALCGPVDQTPTVPLPVFFP